MYLIHIICSVLLLLLCVQKSITATEIKNCSCEHYKKYNVGPFCYKWSPPDPEYCLLSEGNNTRHCPGAMKFKNSSLYLTGDESICNKSVQIEPVPWSWKLRKPFRDMEISQLCIYPLNMLVGTIGNALVIRYFTSTDVSVRPGSRFVVVLAVIDFVTSIIIPGKSTIRILYDPHWPLGGVACLIAYFSPLLLYTTPWLLLAISLERARAVFRPFSARISSKVVILISVIILVTSCVITLRYGLSFRYEMNQIMNNYGLLYIYDKCSDKEIINLELIINTFVTCSLGIWLPMILIGITYIAMYLKLKKEAQITQSNSTLDSQAQLNRISRTFTTVLFVFYICYLPLSVQHAIYYYFKYTNRTINESVYNNCWAISQFLLYTNSCLNPIIYSKVHLKIYNCVRKLVTKCRE